MEEEKLIKEIQFHEGRKAYWENTTDNPFNWDIKAMIAESEARIKSAKEILASQRDSSSEKPQF